LSISKLYVVGGYWWLGLTDENIEGKWMLEGTTEEAEFTGD